MRYRTLTIRVDPKERTLIRAASAILNKTPSQFIREAALERAQRVLRAYGVDVDAVFNDSNE